GSRPAAKARRYFLRIRPSCHERSLDRQTRFAPAVHVPREVDHVGVAGLLEQRFGLGRARAALAVDDDRVGLRDAELAEARLELVDRDVHRARDVAGLEFLGAAHVEHERRAAVLHLRRELRIRDRGATHAGGTTGDRGDEGDGAESASHVTLLIPSLYDEQAPLVGDAAQRVGAAIAEPQARACDEVLHGAGYQDLVRRGERRDARADVHRDSDDALARELALAGVQPRAQLEAHRAHALAHGDGAADGARRTVEGREEAVTGAVDLAAAERGEL